MAPERSGGGRSPCAESRFRQDKSQTGRPGRSIFDAALKMAATAQKPDVEPRHVCHQTSDLVVRACGERISNSRRGSVIWLRFGTHVRASCSWKLFQSLDGVKDRSLAYRAANAPLFCLTTKALLAFEGGGDEVPPTAISQSPRFARRRHRIEAVWPGFSTGYRAASRLRRQCARRQQLLRRRSHKKKAAWSGRRDAGEFLPARDLKVQLSCFPRVRKL